MADKEKKTASEARSELQSSLQNFANYLNELQIVLEDQPDQLHTRIGGVVDHLKEIDAKKDVAIQFPMNVFGCIDYDFNPELYTKEILNHTASEVQRGAARIDAYAEFNSKLLAEVAAAFPDDAQAISGAREMIRKQREGAKK